MRTNGRKSGASGALLATHSRGYAPGGDLGNVLVDGGAADAEQPGDGGHGVVRPGQQVTGVADLLGGHGRRPPEASTAGAGGVQALAGALNNQLEHYCEPEARHACPVRDQVPVTPGQRPRADQLVCFHSARTCGPSSATTENVANHDQEQEPSTPAI